MADLKVYRGRTTVVPIALGVDVTGDDLVAEIRTATDPESTLLATWDVDIEIPALGIGTMTLDDSVADIAPDIDGGWTDILRVTGGQPISLFAAPVRVRFVNMPTAVPG
jgi:hypothetical protein